MRSTSLLAWGIGALVVVAACGGSPFSGTGDAGADASSGSGSGSGGGSSCGGSGGTSGGTSSGGSGGSSGGGIGSGDASSDGPIIIPGDAASCVFPPTKCGPMMCSGTGGQQGSLCCVDPAQTPAFGCASCSCGCATQLECSGGAGCGGAGEICCIKADSCGAGSHMVATCTAAAQCTGQRLCNPAGNALVECAGAGTTCSTDTMAVGIPPGSGYGICM